MSAAPQPPQGEAGRGQLERVVAWFAKIGPRADAWVVVAEHSLDYWARRLAQPLEHERGSDLTLFAPRGSARVFAETIGGELAQDELGTPESECVRLRDGAQSLVVRFVPRVRPLTTSKLRGASPVVLRASAEVGVRVLHPVQLLATLVHEASAASGEDARFVLGRVQCAIACARAYIEGLLARGHVREVLRLNEAVHRHSLSSAGLTLAARHGVPVINALVADDRLPASFLDHQYPAMLRLLSDRLQHRRGLRRDERAPSPGEEVEFHKVTSVVLRGEAFVLILSAQDGRRVEHPAFRTRDVRVGDTVRLLRDGAVQVIQRSASPRRAALQVSRP